MADTPLDKPTTPARGSRKWLFPLIAMALSTLIALGVLEVALRVLRPEPWWQKIVSEQKPEIRGRVAELGGLNLRALPTQIPKADGECRVMFLGDSFTYGSGVRRAADTFVGRLRKRLNKTQPVERFTDYELFNGGVGGSYTRHWLSLHRQTAEKYEPDLVVVVFFLRDGAGPEITTRGMIRQIEEEMNRLPDESLLYRHSHIYRFLRDQAEFRRLSDKYLGTIHTAYFGDAAQTREWQAAQRNLLEIKRRTEAIGARFAFVIFPVLIELNDSYPLRDVCDRLAGFCEERGIPVLSLLPAYLEQNAESLWVSVYDQHPNERGHEIAADALYPFVVEQLTGEQESD